MKTKDQTLNEIAARAGFETLETRKSDRLDFHDTAVWVMKQALEEAYEAGRASTATAARARNARAQAIATPAADKPTTNREHHVVAFTDAYRESHGRDPSRTARGLWIFQAGAAKLGLRFEHNGTYAEALRAAKDYARENDSGYVEVLP